MNEHIFTLCFVVVVIWLLKQWQWIGFLSRKHKTTPSIKSKVHSWLSDLLQNHWIPREDYDRRLREYHYALKRLTEVEGVYSELLMAVENKHPGETRHQTALRYIHEAETTSCDMVGGSEIYKV